MLLSSSQTHSLLMPPPDCLQLPVSPLLPSLPPLAKGESLGRRIPLKKSADLGGKEEGGGGGRQLTAKVKTMGDEEKRGDNRVGGGCGRKEGQRWKGR